MKEIVIIKKIDYEIDGTGRKFKTPIEKRVKKASLLIYYRK